MPLFLTTHGHPDTPGTASIACQCLNAYVEAIEDALDKKAIINLLPLQLGDFPDNSADVRELEIATGCRPQTTVTAAVVSFVEWCRNYYQV